MDDPSNISIASAIEAIRAAAKKAKLSQELEDCLEQLKSIDKLLEISNPWPAAFQRLGSLLRERLLPLYKTFPILGLRFSVSVLSTIYGTRILSAVKTNNDAAKSSWEVVQTAILSGILDFLEARSSSENRAIVATTVYPTLRRIFFPQNAIYQASPELMYILYQLLSETVTSHPDNQAELRKEETLGSAQIGVALSQTKGFLVIEALLELFVKLIPSKTSIGSVQGRMAFIREVFDSSQVSCTASIVEIFETTSTPDWEEIFLRITNLLAHADISFPQPFKISNFHVEGSKAYQIARLYVDHRGFVGNIDEGDQIETFHALITSVQSIKVAPPSASKASVTVLLSPPPSVGQVAIPQQSDGHTTVIFDVEGSDVAKFKCALINRGVRNIDQAGRKLSTAEKTVELDHDLKRTTAPVSTQDKARDLARLWDASNSLLQSGQVLPTSPLVPRRSPSIRIMSAEAPPCPNAQPPAMEPPQTLTPLQLTKPSISSPYYDSIFGSTDEELTDLSDVGAQPFHRALRPGIKREVHSKAKPVFVESEDEIPSAPRKKSKNNTIVVSDDEIGPPSPSPHPAKHTSLRLSLRSSIATKPDKYKSIAKPSSAMEKENLPPKDHTSGALREATNFASKSSPQTTPVRPISPSKSVEEPRGRKRKAIDDEIKRAPSKQPKTDPEAAKSVRSAPKAAFQRPPPRQRYGGRKGRTSSPTPATELDVDFDELPAPSTDAASAKSTDRKPRVSAMRGKGGKAVATNIKPEPTKLEIVDSDSDLVVEFQPAKKFPKKQPIIGNRETIVDDEMNKPDDLVESKPVKKSHTKQAKSIAKTRKKAEDKRPKKTNVVYIHPAKASLKKEAILEPILHETDVDDKPKPQRRSARVAKIDNRPEVVQNGPVASTTGSENPVAPVKEGILPQTPVDDNVVVKHVRSKHAPWMNLDIKKPPAALLAVAPAQAQPITVPDQPIIHEDHSLTAVDPVLDEEDAQEATEDYFMPLKTGSISCDEEAPQTDHVMIDLTQDSPQKPVSLVVALPASRAKTRTPAPTIRDASENPSANQIVTEINKHSIVGAAVFLIVGLVADAKPFGYKRRPSKQLGKPIWDDGEDYNGQSPRKYQGDPMARIIDTINEITHVVVQTTSHRFDKVSKDLRAGQRSILQQTAEDLRVIYDERCANHIPPSADLTLRARKINFHSVEHFYDEFVTLESAYASHNRNITAALEDASKISEEFSGVLAGSIQEHNRNSLSRKFSNTFFSLPLPTVLSNPKLML
ncbi:hypothetical protein DXG03_007277 [Asterophora parasitica]|uniref:Uncharacterized protein n=1 Tax=Asterophora parasitica TaxID=117018 RepID=A0A9P7KDM3_9AGAR|nr:hypothetical protein DXG03_007277 [Asterophora parasitica]